MSINVKIIRLKCKSAWKSTKEIPIKLSLQKIFVNTIDIQSKETYEALKTALTMFEIFTP